MNTCSDEQLHQVLVMKYVGVVPPSPVDLLKEVRRTEKVFNITGSEQKQQQKAKVHMHTAKPAGTITNSTREAKINIETPTRDNPHVQDQVNRSKGHIQDPSSIPHAALRNGRRENVLREDMFPVVSIEGASLNGEPIATTRLCSSVISVVKLMDISEGAVGIAQIMI